MEIELKDYLLILRKRIWLILAFVVVCSTASGVWSIYFLDPVYQASTKLIVNKTNEGPTGISQLDSSAISLNLQLIGTYKEIIKTPAIMSVVAEEHPEFGLNANQLISKVNVSSVNNTQVMTLVVEDGSYQKAASIVNAISSVFQREVPKIMSVDNISILNEASLDENPAPVKPNVKLNIAISFVVSLMIAVGIVFLIEYLDDTLKTDKDVEQLLGLPTLTMIAKMTEEDFQPHGSKSMKGKVTEKRAALDQ
jgi:capsular polysaccharide biosynthesis protein